MHILLGGPIKPVLPFARAVTPCLLDEMVGLVPGVLAHDQTLAVATAAAGKVRRLLRVFLERHA